MGIRRLVLVGILVVVGAALVAAPALGLEAGVLTATDAEETNETADFGEQVSTFAQSSAVEANETIEMGMWEQALNDSEAPEHAIENRLANIEDRIERLEERSQQLEAQRDAGDINEQAYQARASAILTQIQNLERAVNHTQEAGEKRGVGVNQTKLDTLRTNAANMTGPEVSELARNITDAPRGPPEHAGAPDHAGPDNQTERNGPDNQTEQGPPDHAGPGNDTGQGPPGDDDDENQTNGPPADSNSLNVGTASVVDSPT